MTDAQLFGLFAIPRNEDGHPDLPRPFGSDDDPASQWVFKRYTCWGNGITDRGQQETLWQEEKARRVQHRPPPDHGD